VSAPRPRRGLRRRAGALLFAASLALLATVPFARAEEPDRRRLDAEEALEARWRARAQQLDENVERARERLAAAEKAYQEMRAVNHPRGLGKRAVIRRVEDATHALDEARQERARFVAAADDAGVPPSWIDPPAE